MINKIICYRSANIKYNIKRTYRFVHTKHDNNISACELHKHFIKITVIIITIIKNFISPGMFVLFVSRACEKEIQVHMTDRILADTGDSTDDIAVAQENRGPKNNNIQLNLCSDII